MLSTHQQPGRLRFANNLLPTSEGGLATRPGAVQIITGDIAQAAACGNRLLLEKQGRIVIWDGKEADISAAGRGLQATSFQALTTEAKREDRIYVADGIRPLWYIARRLGVYGKYDIPNKVLDENGLAFPIPLAQAVATWRARLWIAYGTNQTQHSQFDDPDYWDPLFVVECQGNTSDFIVALAPSEARLIVGLQKSAWSIAGDTQYNWQRDQMARYGAAGPNAIASDDQLLFWVSAVGLHSAGSNEELAGDLREIFATVQYPAELALDRRRRLLLLLAGGRLFVMHLNKPGRFGEIVGHQPRGLLQMEDYTGWYGADGVWVLGNRDAPDRRLDGTLTGFTNLYDSWEDVPNSKGGGRALLTRSRAVINGSSRGTAIYTATASDKEGEASITLNVSLADKSPDLWSNLIAGLDGELWPAAPVQREFPVNLAGTKFRHQFAADCHMEILSFEPQYKIGEGKSDRN